MRQILITALSLVVSLNCITSVMAQNNGQTVKGKIFDIDSHESLIGATIVITGSSPLIGVTSDVDGNFTLNNVGLGRQTFTISCIGYESKTIPQIMITSGKEVVLDVGLKQMATGINEVVVYGNSDKGRPQNSMAHISARSFTVEETRRYAGGIDDPARLVSAFSGVTTVSLQDNSIIVRGNAPQGVAWRLEGVEIPTPHHFAGANVTGGGIVTLFSSQMMANSDFYTGAFPAEYSDALAAVFDMKLRTGNPDKHEHAMQVGLLGVDVASEGPFSQKSNASYLFNYRYSTFGLLADLKILDTEQLFKYQDLSFKINIPTKRAGVFSLWGIGGIDRATQGVEEDPDNWVVDFDRITFRWDTRLGTSGLTHKLITGANTYIHSTVAISSVQNKMIMRYVNDDLSLQPDMDLVNNSSTITLTSVLNHKLSAKSRIRSGLTYKRLGYNLDIAGTQNFVPGTYQHLMTEDGNANVAGAFAQFKYDFTNIISANIGLHGQYFGLNEEFAVEPRAGLQFTVHPQHVVNLGYGMHSRPEELKMYFMELNGTRPNTSLKVSKAHHFVLEYDWRISKNWRFKVEGYYQHLYDIPGEEGTSFSLINYKQDYMLRKKLINNTIGRNYGVDLTLEKFLSNNYYILTTASFFDAKYKAGDNVWHNTRYNKSYVANLLFGRERFFKNNKRALDYNIRLNFTGGERYSPVLEKESIAQQMIITDETRAFSMQHDPVFYADFTINYRINHKRSSSQISLQVKNVLASSIVENFNYNFKTNSVQLDTSQPVLPVISYKIEF
jgi:hypothetical protein